MINYFEINTHMIDNTVYSGNAIYIPCVILLLKKETSIVVSNICYFYFNWIINWIINYRIHAYFPRVLFSIICNYFYYP